MQTAVELNHLKYANMPLDLGHVFVYCFVYGGDFLPVFGVLALVSAAVTHWSVRVRGNREGTVFIGILSSGLTCLEICSIVSSNDSSLNHKHFRV